MLSFPTHERYQSLLDKTGHEFYLLNRQNEKRWNHNLSPLPENHTEIDFVSAWHDFDLILTHERFGQLQYALQLQKATRWPIVDITHIEPQDRWSKNQFDQMKSFRADIELFITEHNKQSWGFEDGIVLKHGIDTDQFSGWTGPKDAKYILMVGNQIKDRDYFCGFQEWDEIRNRIQEKYPDIEFRLVGENGELGSPAKSMEELVEQYQNCLCYINTSKLSPIPMSLLEASSVGCPIVSTANQECPKVVQDGERGVCSNNIDALVTGIDNYISNPEFAKLMGDNMREYILEHYNLDKFINHWNFIFKKAYDMSVGAACTRVLI